MQAEGKERMRQGGKAAGRGRPKKGSARTTIKQQRGRRYLQDRLLRDYPEVHARYLAGELPSVHAAAMAAGLVKPRRSVHSLGASTGA